MVKIINAFREDRPVGQVLANLGSQLFGDMASGEINRQQAYALQRSNAETDNLMNWMRTGQNLDQLSPDAAAMLLGSGYSPADFGRIGNIFASTNYGARDPRTTNYAAGIGEYGRTAEAFDRDQANQVAMNDADNAAALARQNALPLPALDAAGNPTFTTNGATAGFAPVLTNAERQGTVAGQMDMTPAAAAAYVGAEPQMETVRGPGGTPILVPRADASGLPAAVGLDTVRGGLAQDVLATEGGLAGADLNTQAFLGADTSMNAPTVKNYRDPDGNVFLVTDESLLRGQDVNGHLLPPGGQLMSTTLQAATADDLAPSARGRMDELEFAYTQLDDLATQLIAAIDETDPRNFGVAGQALNLGRGIVTTVANLAGLVGAEGLDANTLRQQVMSTTPVDPTDPVQPSTWDLVFSPEATELQTLGGIFLWRAASALAGQGGRELSNADMLRVIRDFGSPTSWGTDQVLYRQKISSIQDYTRTQIDLVRALRGREPINWAAGGTPTNPAGNAGAAAPATPAVTTGTLTPNPDGTLTWQP